MGSQKLDMTERTCTQIDTVKRRVDIQLSQGLLFIIIQSWRILKYLLQLLTMLSFISINTARHDLHSNGYFSALECLRLVFTF